MRERCALYGGDLTVDAGSTGMTVRARIPRRDAAPLPPAVLTADTSS